MLCSKMIAISRMIYDRYPKDNYTNYTVPLNSIYVKREYSEMASQLVIREAYLACCKICSFVRGVQAYQEQCQPRTSQILNIKREPDNCQHKHAVVIVTAGNIMVRHCPII